VARPVPKFKSSTIRPIRLRGSLHDIAWADSINPQQTNCTYADILLSIATTLMKVRETRNVDYINVNTWVESKLFSRHLNSTSCVLHDGKHVVAAPTYE
jgi:hypothetical protein